MSFLSAKHLNSLSEFLKFVEKTPDITSKETLLSRGEKLQKTFLQDVPFLVISLMGGTGVGKSQMINAFVGEEVSASSSLRAFTEHKVFYIHSDYKEVLEHLKIFEQEDSLVVHSSEIFKDIVLVDLPDFDGYIKKHKQQVDTMVKHTDITIWVIDYNKYNDASIHREYLKPLSVHQDSFVFALNKIDELLKYGGSEAKSEIDEITDDFVCTLREQDDINASRKDVFRISAMNAFMRKKDPSKHSKSPVGDWKELEALVFDSKRLKIKKYNRHIKEAESLVLEVIDKFPSFLPETMNECMEYTREFLSNFVDDVRPLVLSTANMECLSLQFFALVKKQYSERFFTLFFEPLSVSWFKTVFNFNNSSSESELMASIKGCEDKKDSMYMEEKREKPCVNEDALNSFLDVRMNWFANILKGNLSEESLSSVFCRVRADLDIFLSDYWKKLPKEASKWGAYGWKQWVFPVTVFSLLFVQLLYLFKVDAGIMLFSTLQNLLFYIPLSYAAGVLYFRRRLKRRFVLWKNLFTLYLKEELNKEMEKRNKNRDFLSIILKDF